MRPLLFVLIFLIIFQFFNKKEEQNLIDDVILAAKSKISIGNEVVIQVKNNSETEIIIPNNCPKNPLSVERYVNGEWIPKEAEIAAENCAGSKEVVIAPGENYTVGFNQWSWDLFNEEGKYRITLNTSIDENEKAYTHEFNITAPSFLKKFWNNVFYKPILNTLIFLISVMPGNNLGWGIILLTLIIKIILLGPNHKALKAQRAMQKVQPQLDALKIKYKNDPQRLSSETMAIWKKYKVSPMSSCLPMLIQFPILIAIFYVVKNGFNVINPDMLYSTLKEFDILTINPHFLGIIDLTKINIIALPIIVGGLQFIQMRLTLGKVKTNSLTKKDDAPNPMAGMGKMMQYVMPVMIAVFTASLPAAVGFYWGTSTLFGIGQQVIVNKSKD
ncbi:YidC/Oxa1 family membrane protein insertase [Patescibacteria group bacterium]|nr:YidC/Oxa1 family membrane protein insertase [Patescibacteria group bacterium]